MQYRISKKKTYFIAAKRQSYSRKKVSAVPSAIILGRERDGDWTSRERRPAARGGRGGRVRRLARAALALLHVRLAAPRAAHAHHAA